MGQQPDDIGALTGKSSSTTSNESRNRASQARHGRHGQLRGRIRGLMPSQEILQAGNASL
jgi:hypothetical protein